MSNYGNSISGTAGTTAAATQPQFQPRNDLWISALAKLSADDRLRLNFGQTNRRLILEDLNKILIQKQQLCLDKRWKFVNGRGQTVIVRDLFEKISHYVRKFTDIVDIAVQYDPAHAALPWAAVRFFLQIVVNATDLYGVMIENVEKVSAVITRYAIIENMYLTKQSALKKLLESEISKLYLAVLQCMVKMSRYFGQTTGAMLMKSPFKSIENDMLPVLTIIDATDKEVQALLRLVENEDQSKLHNSTETLSTSVTNVTNDLQNLHLDMWHGFTSLHQHCTNAQDLIDSKLSDVQYALAKINSDVQRPFNRLTFQLNQVEDNLSKQQRLEVLLWLSKVAYRKHHVTMCTDLLPGSCAWLESNPVFLGWSNASVSSVLWLHGIPGSGKSKLVAHIVQLFQNQAHSQLASAPLAYFYCVRATAEPERADPDEIMRAILKQIAKAKVDQPLRRPILTRFEQAQKEAMEDGSEPSPLTIEECISLILEILEDTSAIIILDALDECDPSRRHELLRALKEIVAKANNLVKIFLSSRDQADIVLKLVDVPNIYISSTDNFDDIKRFVTVKVDKAIQEQRLLGGKVSPGLRDDIISKLSRNAQGMFLWVSLQLQSICDFERIQLVEDLLEELHKVPQSLQHLYDGAMRQIYKKGTRARASALKALQWILSAERPLSCEALVQAVNEVVETTLTTSDIVDLCNNLVVIDEELNVFRFAHLSVREYLESRDDFSSNFVHQSLALQCLRKCLSTLCKESVSAVDFDGSRYRCYAVLYWPLHCQLAGSGLSQPLVDMLSDFLKSKESSTPTYATWIHFVCSLKTSRIEEKSRIWFKLISSRPPHPIFLVITFDLNIFLQSTLEMPGLNENLVNSLGLSPLALACNLGRIEAARMLLDKGEMVNITRSARHWSSKYGGWFDYPLSAAVAHGHKKVVSMLLNAGAEPNTDAAKCMFHSPLTLAVQTGDQALVKMLLNAGATVTEQSEQSGKFGSALCKAAYYGDEDICRLLLDHGADPNLSINPNLVGVAESDSSLWGEYGPLEIASGKGHIRIVQLLHEKGAIVDNFQDEYGGTALAHAASEGSEDVVRYLLDHKANPNLESGPHGSPFLSAVASGNVDVAKIMLAHDADMNAPGRNRGPALAIAIQYDCDSTVSLLLDHGANVWQPFSCWDTCFDNALEFAASEGNLNILQQLVSSARDGAKYLELGGILLAAVEGRSKILGREFESKDRGKIIDWLLQNGADVNSKLSDGTSALHIAVARAEVDVIHRLLSYGAQINAMNNSEGSILQAFFSPRSFNDRRRFMEDRQYCEVFEILVEADADINARGGGCGDALQAAASLGASKEIYQLLNLGATLNVGIGKYGSAIHAAAACGYATTAVAVLTSGIDPNIICEPYGSPLQAAACRGRIPASQFLNSDPEVSRNRKNAYVTLVSQRNACEFKDTFNTLLKAGADVHCRGGQFGTALQAAAYVGDEEVVKHLLRAKVNPLVKGGFYGTALQAVAAGEDDSVWFWSKWPSSEDSVVFPEEENETEPDHHANTMEILLKAGADVSVNEECGFFGTSLQAAVHSDNPVLVRKLLKTGAKVTEDGKGHYGGCISAAIGFGKRKLRGEPYFDDNSAEILRLLLEYIPEQDFVQACRRAASRARQNGNEEGLGILRKVFPEMAREREITVDLGLDSDDTITSADGANGMARAAPLEA